MTFARIVLGLAALLLLATGLAFLIDPVRSAALVSIRLPATISVSDIRAVYGGLEMGLGGVFAWTAWKGAFVRPALALLVAISAGSLLGRFVSVAFDGVPESPGLTLIGIEFAALVLAVIGYERAGRSGVEKRCQEPFLDL